MRSFHFLILILPFLVNAQDNFQTPPALPSAEILFIENKGQLLDMEKRSISFVYFKASAPGVDIYLTEKGLTYTFFKLKNDHIDPAVISQPGTKREIDWERVDMQLQGASIRKENITAEGKDQSAHNFFLSHCKEGIRGVNAYSRITVRNVYPGIDWVLYNATGKGFKYDFIVHPGANPSDIVMSYYSVFPAILNNDHSIQVSHVIEEAPRSYLKETGKTVASSFLLLHRFSTTTHCRTDFGIRVKKTHGKQTLVIDPNLTWGTYYGGSYWDGPTSMESDSKGNLYICGASTSPDFPRLSNGTYFQGIGSAIDFGFILKFSKAGQLLRSVVYADTNNLSSTVITDLCIDKYDNVFVCGNTNGPALPMQSNATFFQPALMGVQDAFIVKFDSAGYLLWATFFGGNRADWATSIVVNNTDDIYLVGATTSTMFPLQNPGGYYESVPDSNGCGFITRFSNSGVLLWSTFYRAFSPKGCAVDASQNLIVTGQANAGFSTQNLQGAFFQPYCAGYDDAGVVKFNTGNNRTWATFFGGSSSERAFSVVTDQAGDFFLLGATNSTNIPVQNSGGYFKPTLTGSGDAFLTKFTSAGVLAWSTYYGGSNNEGVSAFDNFDIDKCGNLYVGIDTYSTDMPWMQSCEGGYLDSTFNGISDHFICRFSPAQVRQWGTYLGGSNFDYRTMIELDNSGDLYMGGYWNANGLSGLPLVNPGPPAYFDGTPNAYLDIGIIKFTNPNFTPSFNYPQPGCSVSGTVGIINPQLAPSGIFSSAPGLVLNPVTGILNSNLSLPGIYTVTYSAIPNNGACNCSVSPQSAATATYQVLLRPTLAVAGPTMLCQGEVTTLTVSGAATYSWSNSLQTPVATFNPAGSGQYFVIGFSVDGCSDTINFSLVSALCLGQPDLSGESRISVYPNPSAEEITVCGKLPGSIILYDMTGNAIKQIELLGNNEPVMIRGLATGVYILKDISSQEKYKLIVR